MSDLEYHLTRKRLMAAWSDRWQTEAAKFADGHRDLLPRRITNAQLYGLSNIVRSAQRYADIRKFIEHQADKAGRAGRQDAQGYWSDLSVALDKLKVEAQSILKQLSLPPETDNKLALDELHRDLAGTYVQHLIAHSLYWTPEETARR